MSVETAIATIATQLAKQRRRSTSLRIVSDHSNCRYRGRDGAMCAVGCLIPDSLASEIKEGAGARALLNRRDSVSDNLLSQFPDLSYIQVERLLCAFQVFHDRQLFDGHDTLMYGTSESYTSLLTRHANADTAILEQAIVDSLRIIAKTVLLEPQQ